MANLKTKGLCSSCKSEVPKNKRSIMSHILKCKEGIGSNNSDISPHMVILIDGKYDPGYWLVIKARLDITMKELDNFLRDIWVECCGHLSSFFDGPREIGMKKKLDDVFEKGRKISYVYDFGTSTEIKLSLVETYESEETKNIQVLIRNKEADYRCSYCNNKAIYICPYCLDEEEGLLCESCSESHDCIEVDGGFLLPLVNSPRTGECGYGGYEEKKKKKYFPKEII